MASSVLQFDELSHIYQFEGKVIPSVTQVLTLAGISDVSMIPWNVLEKARLVGEFVHTAAQYLDEGDLDLETIDKSIVGYLVGYQQFKEEHSFRPSKIEHRMVGEFEGMAYGMCLDRLGWLKNASGDDYEVLLDLKTSSRPSASWAIQTAAYADGYNYDGARMVVHLSKEGKYKILPHNDDERDFSVWRAALRVAYWRLENGAKLK